MKNTPGIILISCVFGCACFYTIFQNGLNRISFLNCLFLFILFIVSIADIRTMIIPDSCHVGIIILGILTLLFSRESVWPYLLGLFVISVPLLLIAIFFGGFGGGDIKLCAACGFYLGAPLVTLGAVLGTVLAAVYAIILILLCKAKRDDAICFGPFLALGFLISLLFGEPIIQSYLSLLQ